MCVGGGERGLDTCGVSTACALCVLCACVVYARTANMRGVKDGRERWGGGGADGGSAGGGCVGGLARCGARRGKRKVEVRAVCEQCTLLRAQRMQPKCGAREGRGAESGEGVGGGWRREGSEMEKK